MKQNTQYLAVEKINFSDNSKVRILFGDQDKNLKQLEKSSQVKLASRSGTITITGEVTEVTVIKSLLLQLYGIIEKGYPIYPPDIDYAHRILSENINIDLEKIFLDAVFISSKKRIITPKSIAQKAYIDAIRASDMVFGIGPAGTGKTYLAMAMALSALMDKRMSRIVLARPAVEAGEKLGFLPGDLSEKVNPYLRPLYDALFDMIDFDKASALIGKGVIEVAPLAFMRGRTLNNSFVILDEAQNTTSEQMKMFLTRLGYGSKAVITGDVTQIDLPSDKTSGLIEAGQILRKTEGIRIIYFTEVDILRHPLVQDVIKAYQHEGNKKERKR